MSSPSNKLYALGLLWLRLLMGIGIAHHGFGKVFGGHIDKFAQGVAHDGLPFPLIMAWAAALSEFLGGICIAIGFQTQLAAFFVFATMSVAIFIHHAADPLSVKELALCYWTMAATLILTGGGPYTVEVRLKK